MTKIISMIDLDRLDLHESIETDFGIMIMRVPGGWIYDAWDKSKDEFKNGTFVPYDRGLI